MTKDLGVGMLSTYASGNRQTDLSLGCGPCSGPYTGFNCSQLHKVQEPLENTVLDNHSQTEPRWKSRSPVEKFQHTVGTENTSLCSLERIRGTGWLMSPLPQSGVAQCQERTSLLWFLLQGNWDHVSGQLASPAIQDIAKETLCPFAPSRVLSHELPDWRTERAWERGRQESQRTLKGHGSY